MAFGGWLLAPRPSERQEELKNMPKRPEHSSRISKQRWLGARTGAARLGRQPEREPRVGPRDLRGPRADPAAAGEGPAAPRAGGPGDTGQEIVNARTLEKEKLLRESIVLVPVPGRAFSAESWNPDHSGILMVIYGVLAGSLFELGVLLSPLPFLGCGRAILAQDELRKLREKLEQLGGKPLPDLPTAAESRPPGALHTGTSAGTQADCVVGTLSREAPSWASARV